MKRLLALTATAGLMLGFGLAPAEAAIANIIIVGGTQDRPFNVVITVNPDAAVDGLTLAPCYPTPAFTANGVSVFYGVDNCPVTVPLIIRPEQ